MHSGAEGCNPVFTHWPNLSLGAGDTLSRIRHSGIKRCALAESSTRTWRMLALSSRSETATPSPPPLFLLPDFSPPSRLHRWQAGVGIRGARRSSPRQRSHCFSLNNTSAIFELRCQRERYRILLPFCAVQTPPSPENAGTHVRERDATKQHYPAIKRRVLSTVRSFFFSSLQRASRYMPVSVTNSIVFLRSTTKGCRPSTSQASRTSVRRPTSIRNICIINRAPHAVPISSASPPVRAGGGDNK